MFSTSLALLLSTAAIAPGTGTLWLDGQAHAMEVTVCDREPATAGATGTLDDGSIVTVMLQLWPGMHALSVTYRNGQWIHRGAEDSDDQPQLRDWTEDGELAASGTVAFFPAFRNERMEVRFEGRCPE